MVYNFVMKVKRIITTYYSDIVFNLGVLLISSEIFQECSRPTFSVLGEPVCHPNAGLVVGVLLISIVFNIMVRKKFLK